MAHKKEILARALGATGLGPLLRRVRPWRGLLILNYHRIGDPQKTSFDPGVFSGTAGEFDVQLGWLRKNADVVSLNDLDRVFQTPRGRFVLLTFDDGYRDNFELAFPLLQKHGIPAAFFITTGFIDKRYIAWWDEIAWIIRHATRSRLPQRPQFADFQTTDWTAVSRAGVLRRSLETYKSLPTMEAILFLNELAEACGAGRCPQTNESAPWMDWSMIETMHRAGHSIAAHTVTHPLMARCELDQQRAELAGSKRRLEQQLQTSIEAFSYPVGIPGSYTDETTAIVRETGYRWAFSFQGGHVDFTAPQQDRYRLPRVAMESGLSRPRFQALHTLPSLFA